MVLKKLQNLQKSMLTKKLQHLDCNDELQKNHCWIDNQRSCGLQ